MTRPALADALFVEEVARARVMSPEEKLFEGPRLFDRACRLMADGIRNEHPDLDDAAVGRLVEDRLALAAALERSA